MREESYGLRKLFKESASIAVCPKCLGYGKITNVEIINERPKYSMLLCDLCKGEKRITKKTRYDRVF